MLTNSIYPMKCYASWIHALLHEPVVHTAFHVPQITKALRILERSLLAVQFSSINYWLSEGVRKSNCLFGAHEHRTKTQWSDQSRIECSSSSHPKKQVRFEAKQSSSGTPLPVFCERGHSHSRATNCTSGVWMGVCRSFASSQLAPSFDHLVNRVPIRGLRIRKEGRKLFEARKGGIQSQLLLP